MLFPRVATFALPLNFVLPLQNLYNTADMYGRALVSASNGLGGAVSICGPIKMVPTLTLNGLSSAFQSLANYKGGDSSETFATAWLIALYAVLALAATLLGQLFIPTDSMPCADAGESFRRHPLPARRFPGAAFSSAIPDQRAISTIGDSKSPLFILTASSVNVVLDYLCRPAGLGSLGRSAGHGAGCARASFLMASSISNASAT